MRLVAALPSPVVLIWVDVASERLNNLSVIRHRGDGGHFFSCRKCGCDSTWQRTSSQDVIEGPVPFRFQKIRRRTQRAPSRRCVQPHRFTGDTPLASPVAPHATQSPTVDGTIWYSMAMALQCVLGSKQRFLSLFRDRGPVTLTCHRAEVT